jgi:hypothetical protein
VLIIKKITSDGFLINLDMVYGYKSNILRLCLHSAFLLVLVFNQSFMKALYVGGYHFSWAVDFQPASVMFYANIIFCIYITAFVALNKRLPTPLKFVGIVCMFFFFIFSRYFFDQILELWLFGTTNYGLPLTFAFFFHDNLFLSLVVLAGGLFLRFMDDWLIHDRIRDHLEKQNLRLELDFLKSQVNPHFLFNTLNNIQSYIYQDEKMKSIEMIGQLSDFMRFTLYECEEEFIGLHKEVDMLSHYVELERIRCEDRVDIDFNIQGTLSGYKIPPLLLMPFIENAFKHGAVIDKSSIVINIGMERDCLTLQVVNNFVSMGLGKSGGIGLQNARKRLQYYYPGKHQLEISSRGDVFSIHLKLTLQP